MSNSTKPTRTTPIISNEELTEVRSFAKPPDAVFCVVRAALLLLGVDEQQSKHWNISRKCLTSRDPSSPVNRTVEASSIHPEIAARAREILVNGNCQNIQSVSMATYALYQWAWKMLATIDTGAPAAGIERQRAIFRQAAMMG